jgi:hypothetical protein
MTGRISSFDGGYVLPNKPSNLRLSGGDEGSWYSLSSQSNLPYVALTGAEGFQKTISWGETAYVPCGMLVTVQNASAHGGNLIINGGQDVQNQPSRITVPVFVGSAGGEFDPSQALSQLDTRRAKRAYLVIDLFIVADLTVTVVGRADKSLPTENTIAPPNVGQGYQYDQVYTSGPGLQMPPIPLGFRASQGDDSRPMILLDRVQVYFGSPVATPAAYYLAEY